jgi:hypothetical protein
MKIRKMEKRERKKAAERTRVHVCWGGIFLFFIFGGGWGWGVTSNSPVINGTIPVKIWGPHWYKSNMTSWWSIVLLKNAPSPVIEETRNCLMGDSSFSTQFSITLLASLLAAKEKP